MEAPIEKKRKTRKRSAPRHDEHDSSAIMETGVGTLTMDEPISQYDPDEPTMGEKLMGLSPVANDELDEPAQEDRPAELKPPSADSVHLLLKQALRAEDHALLLNCLYTKDEQVIGNSVSSLNPSDALRLLDSLVSMLQSRGAVLLCCIPWLRTLLVRHASSIISHPSSPVTLNSLYQLADSRVSTFGSALRLAACLEDVFAGIPEEGDEEDEVQQPVIFEDWDTEEEGSAGARSEDDDDDEDLGDVIDLPHGDSMLHSAGDEDEDDDDS